MAVLNFYINNQQVPPPENWPELEIELLFNNNTPEATIKTSTLIWEGENARRLNDWYNLGLINGVGILEGIPLRITACNPPVVVFDGCINMTSLDTTFQCDVVKAAVVDTQRIQFMNDLAQSINFAYLFQQGKITKSDYIAVPYVLSNHPDYLQIAMLITTFIQMYKTIGDATQTLISITDNLIAAATNATATLGATIASVVWWTVILVAYTIYVIFLVTIAIGVFLMIVNEIVQPIKYKYGMKVVDLFTKAAAYFGLGFSSSILQGSPYNTLVHVPAKSAYFINSTFADTFLLTLLGAAINRKLYDDILNPNAYGYYEGTFKQLIDEYGEYFNCTDEASGQTGICIRNGVLFFERWDYFNGISPFIIAPISIDAPFPDANGVNASEIAANYNVIYAQDTQDANTYDQYDGTSCQMTLKPITIIQPKNVLLRGLTQKSLPFALAKRKLSLTVAEKVVNAILPILSSIYNPLVALLNGVMSLVPNAGPIPYLPSTFLNTKIGCMLLSSDFTGIPKVLVVTLNNGSINGSKIGYIDPNNSSTSLNSSGNPVKGNGNGWTDAYRISIQYHAASWGIDTINGNHNQYLTYKDREIPLCCRDFDTLSKNNVVMQNNKFGLINTLAWNPHMETAKISYRIKQKWTNNLTQTIIIDGTT